MNMEKKMRIYKYDTNYEKYHFYVLLLFIYFFFTSIIPHYFNICTCIYKNGIS